MISIADDTPLRDSSLNAPKKKHVKLTAFATKDEFKDARIQLYRAIRETGATLIPTHIKGCVGRWNQVQNIMYSEDNGELKAYKMYEDPRHFRVGFVETIFKKVKEIKLWLEKRGKPTPNDIIELVEIADEWEPMLKQAKETAEKRKNKLNQKLKEKKSEFANAMLLHSAEVKVSKACNLSANESTSVSYDLRDNTDDNGIDNKNNKSHSLEKVPTSTKRTRQESTQSVRKRSKATDSADPNLSTSKAIKNSAKPDINPHAFNRKPSEEASTSAKKYRRESVQTTPKVTDFPEPNLSTSNAINLVNSDINLNIFTYLIDTNLELRALLTSVINKNQEAASTVNVHTKDEQLKNLTHSLITLNAHGFDTTILKKKIQKLINSM